MFERRRHPGLFFFRGSVAWPMRTPVNASPVPSRMPAHDSGSMWVATPSPWWTLTTYFLPVSRRTRAKKTPSQPDCRRVAIGVAEEPRGTHCICLEARKLAVEMTRSALSSDLGSEFNDFLCALIGIGGRLATPPLPHHRAYGSVPRRFESLANTRRTGTGGRAI